MNLLKIKNLCENRNGGLKKLSIDLGMSEANLHRCINHNKIQASDLEKIASLLNVSIGVFFDDNEVVVPYDLLEAKKEIEHLRAKLNDSRISIASTKVLIELDVSQDEFVKMGLKDKLIQVLNK